MCAKIEHEHFFERLFPVGRAFERVALEPRLPAYVNPARDSPGGILIALKKCGEVR